MEIQSIREIGIDKAVQLWNRCLNVDQINKKNFCTRIIYDVNFDPSKYLIAIVDGKPAGFVYAVLRRVPDEAAGLESGNAWIVAMGVDPIYRRKGTGGNLLSKIEDILAGKGIRRIEVGPYVSNYISPGVDRDAYNGGIAFLYKNGYSSESEACSMCMNLQDYQTPEKYRIKKEELEKDGYVFRPYTPDDAIAFFDFLGRNFPSWLIDVRNSIIAGRGEDTLIGAYDKNGDVAGFVLRAMDGTPERFGPFGTKADHQGKGIGGILFHEMMENMVRSRIYFVYFLWGDGRNPGIYGTWGMKPYRYYDLLCKNIGR